MADLRSPGVFGVAHIPHEPRFRVGDYVTMPGGTRPGACHRIVECLGILHTDIKRRWYMVEIVAGVKVRVCESDLAPAEVITELGRIARG